MKYAAALLLSLLPLLATAMPGEPLAPFTLLDQHDKAYHPERGHPGTTGGARHGRRLVKAALADAPKDYLEARKAVFVADIQRMPALISKLFAIPAMRGYSGCCSTGKGG